MDPSLIKEFLVPEIKYFDANSDLGTIDVLFVFGVEEKGSSFLAHSPIGEQNFRFLIFIESDEKVFLEAKGMDFFKNPQVRLYYLKDGDEEIFKQIAWEFVFLRFGYSKPSLPIRDSAADFFYKMEHYHRGIDLLASDCEDMGVKVLSNAIKNLSLLPYSHLGGNLEGVCEGVPAIICGAGPSLDEAIPLLSGLKNKALLIAGGSAIAALQAHGIYPHLCAYIDPDPSPQRFLIQENFETPFFYQGRFSHELLKRVHSPLFWMPDGGSYPLEGWLAGECGVFSEPFEAGWTVSNFCASLASHLGCSQVVFVGMDFSCGAKEVYASNLSEDRKGLVELQENRIYSKRDWLMAAEWMGTFAKKNPGIQWMNASSRGIDLPGIERKSLQEIAEAFPDQTRDMDSFVHSFLSKASLSNVSLGKVQDVREKVKKSFEKSLLLCDGLLKLWEKSFPCSPLEKGEYAALEHDLQQEICSQFFLVPLWSVWKRPILRSSFHDLGHHLHRLLFYKKAIEVHLKSSFN